jgi:tRNA threonylcarbamoyladenosine biosynthesis protein TsaB
VILALETATEACSIALGDGTTPTAPWVRRHEPARAHAELVLPMVAALLRDAGIALEDLDAIAFGRGPGSFTGVRLAASIAQGLAFGARRPVIGVSSLAAVAQAALELEPQATCVLVCNDARMGEVYWAWFGCGAAGEARALGPERVGAPGSVDFAPPELPAAEAPRAIGAGRGFAVYPELATAGALRLAAVQAGLLPSADAVLRLAAPELAAGRVLAPRDALPAYVRDDVARPQAPRRSP